MHNSDLAQELAALTTAMLSLCGSCVGGGYEDGYTYIA